MEPLLCLVIVLIIACYLYVTRNFNYWRACGVPFEKPVPFLGNVPVVLFQKSLGTYLKDLYEKSSGPLYGFFIFDRPQLLVRDPEIIKQILVKDFQYFYNRTLVMNKKDDPIGSQILFVIHNPDWKQVRQKISSAFSSGKLRTMVPVMAEVGKDMVKYVEQLKGAPTEGKTLALKFSTDVIASCAFGVKGSSFEEENSKFHEVATKLFAFTWSRGVQMTCYFIAPLLVHLFKMKFMHPDSVKFLRRLFWQIFHSKKQSDVKQYHLIDSVMETKGADGDRGLAIDDDLAIAQAVLFVAAGYETSGSTACFALYELALHSDIQNRLREEIAEVCSKHGRLTYDAIKEMTYLDMVLSETLRRYPVLPFLDRRAQSDYKIPGTDVTIHKGTPVYMASLGIHFDHQYYPDPTRFDPERFTPERKAERPKMLYLPFGEGPRNCIGARFGVLSAKVSVVSMISEFEVLKTDETPSHLDFDPRGFLLHPTKKIPLRFRKLDSSRKFDS